MYRSQEDALIVQSKQFQKIHPETWPICVPSYNRPNPKILASCSEDIPLVFFVRREQLREYSHLRSAYRVIPIDGVTNIGETRAKIVKWAQKKGYDNIFMLDDDITQLDYLYPYKLPSGKTSMRSHGLNCGTGSKELSETAFKMWMLWLDRLDSDVAMSAPLYRPDSWHMKNADADMRYNSAACIQCIHLNTKLLKETGITYRSSDEVGNEDYALQFQIMEAGLKTCVITDLVYNCPPINSSPGGCEGASGIADPNERYKKYVRLFKRNVSGKNHPGILIKDTRTGVPSIKFNWKYWRSLL